MPKFKQFISEIKMRAISQKPSQWLTGDEELKAWGISRIQLFIKCSNSVLVFLFFSI